MRRLSGCTAFGLAAVLVFAVSPLVAQVRVASPDGRNEVTVEVRAGRLTYAMTRDRRTLVLPSALGFEFRGAPALRDCPAASAAHHRVGGLASANLPPCSGPGGTR